MTEQEKRDYLTALDEELLHGRTILPEWAFVFKDADLAFVEGEYLLSIFLAMAAIEAHLRAEDGTGTKRLVDLIAGADLAQDLKVELQFLRWFRNKWVFVGDPLEHMSLRHSPEHHELEEMAKRCVAAMRRIIYTNPRV
jgi:hypothetical protein